MITQINNYFTKHKKLFYSLYSICIFTSLLLAGGTDYIIAMFFIGLSFSNLGNLSVLAIDSTLISLTIAFIAAPFLFLIGITISVFKNKKNQQLISLLYLFLPLASTAILAITYLLLLIALN